MRLFSDVWSENAALFKRLMKNHSNPPILYYGFKGDTHHESWWLCLDQCKMRQALLMLGSLTPSSAWQIYLVPLQFYWWTLPINTVFLEGLSAILSCLIFLPSWRCLIQHPFSFLSSGFSYLLFYVKISLNIKKFLNLNIVSFHVFIFDFDPIFFIFFYLSIYLSISICLSSSIYKSLFLSMTLSIYLYLIYLSVCLSVYPSISILSIYLSISLSNFIYLSIYLSVYLAICLSIHPSIHLSIHSSIRLSM